MVQHESLFSCVLRFAQCVSFELCKRLARQAVDTEPTTTRPVTKVPVAFRLLLIEVRVVGKGDKKSPEIRTESAVQGFLVWKKRKSVETCSEKHAATLDSVLASPRGFEPLSTA